MSNIIDEYPRIEEKIKKRDLKDIHYIVVHHTVMDDEPIKADVYRLLKYFASKDNHITPGKPLPAPAYHEIMEVVEGKVEFFEISYSQDITYHAGNWNKNSYGISINQMDYEELTVDQYKRLVGRLADLCIQFNINPGFIRGHRELKGTGWFLQNKKFKLRKICPGFVNLRVLREDVHQHLRNRGFFRGLIDEKQYIDKKYINGFTDFYRELF